MIPFRHKRAASIIEYTMLFVVVMATMVVMQKYVLRAVSGRWKTVGDSFGFGRQYDPKKTLECAYYTNGNFWYEVPCAQSNNCVFGDDACYVGCQGPKCN